MSAVTWRGRITIETRSNTFADPNQHETSLVSRTPLVVALSPLFSRSSSSMLSGPGATVPTEHCADEPVMPSPGSSGTVKVTRSALLPGGGAHGSDEVAEEGSG